MVHSAVAEIKPNKKDGKYITSEFAPYVLFKIIDELFSIHQQFNSKYGEIHICLDSYGKNYWRKEIYPGYKGSRKKGRDESEINFGEVFENIDGLLAQIEQNLPWPVLESPGAEADDIILVLAKVYSQVEDILIHSPDKDMLQSQRGTTRVKQYSPLTKKWLVPENKHDSMDDWILEHVCLGDAGDEVPKVVDHTEFTEVFINFLKENGIEIYSPHEMIQLNESGKISSQELIEVFDKFDVWKLNRKGENTGVKDIYKYIRFGPSTLKKEIKKHGSLDNWLDSHPLYRKHFDRNYALVMEEGIPDYIRENIMESFKSAKKDYNDKVFEEYLNENGLKSVLMRLPSIFKLNRELTADDFGW